MVDSVMGEEGTNNEEGTGSPMWEYLKEEYDYKRPKRGDIRYAEVLRIDDDEIIVDIGGKTEGVVPSVDLERMGEEAISEIEVGDKVPVYVLRPESADGDVIVSLNMARTMEDWRRAEKLYDEGEVFEGTVAGHNKGGLLVYFGQIRGFVPASQLSGLSRRSGHEERMQTLSKMEGQKLLLKVIEVDRQRRRLIFSERAASREWREKRKSELLDDLQEGDIREGTVRNLCDFGAFVDLGGADGLIHISELSWRRVRHARDVLKVGDDVEVYVLRVDRERKRIGLSLKRLQPDPWQVIEDKYEVGQIVKGTITNIVDFGAFARVEDGIEGLIHVSELSDGDFAPQDLVQEGEQLYLKVLSIDLDRQRMGLSLKQAPSREEMEGEEAWARMEEEVEPDLGPEAEAQLEVAPSIAEEGLGEEERAAAEVEALEMETPPEFEEPVAEIAGAETDAEPAQLAAELTQLEAEAELEEIAAEVAELQAEAEIEEAIGAELIEEAAAEIAEVEAEMEAEELPAEIEEAVGAELMEEAAAEIAEVEAEIEVEELAAEIEEAVGAELMEETAAEIAEAEAEMEVEELAAEIEEAVGAELMEEAAAEIAEVEAEMEVAELAAEIEEAVGAELMEEAAAEIAEVEAEMEAEELPAEIGEAVSVELTGETAAEVAEPEAEVTAEGLEAEAAEPEAEAEAAEEEPEEPVAEFGPTEMEAEPEETPGDIETAADAEEDE